MCWGRTLAVRDELRVIDCVVCKHAHLDPIPEESKIEAYYKDDRFYTEHSPPEWFAKERKEFKAGLWNAAYDYQLSLLSGYPVLDVGCGIGGFLARTYELGTFGIGIEPSKIALGNMLHRNNVVFRDIDKANMIFEIDKITMDVRMALVLEHIPEPVRFLESYAKYLKEKGRMMIIVPNEFSPLQKKVRGDWFVSKVHINYFNPTGLRNVMQEAGMKVIHESATFPMELFILAGMDYRKNDELGKKLHAARLRFERTFGKNAFRLYNHLYKKYGWGRELIFVGSK